MHCMEYHPAHERNHAADQESHKIGRLHFGKWVRKLFHDLGNKFGIDRVIYELAPQ